VVRAVEALTEVQRTGIQMASALEPGLFVKTDGHEREIIPIWSPQRDVPGSESLEKQRRIFRLVPFPQSPLLD
jgi:hypothetical protein